MEDLKQGDILKNEDGEIKVLGVCGEIIFISQYDNFEKADDCAYAIQDLKGLNFTKKEPKWYPKEGETVFFSTVDRRYKTYSMVWTGEENQQTMFNRGIVFKLEVDAVAKTNKMLEK